MTKFYIPFGENLKKIRLRNGKTITKLANDLNISRSHLSKMENGHYPPTRELIYNITTLLELSLKEKADLFTSAGYGTEGQKLIQNFEGKEVYEKMDKNQTQAVTEKKDNEIGLEVSVPANTPILYTDSVHINSNPFGLVLDFAQSLGATYRQTVVSRVGMSREHARALLKVLEDHLKATDNPGTKGTES